MIQELKLEERKRKKEENEQKQIQLQAQARQSSNQQQGTICIDSVVGESVNAANMEALENMGFSPKRAQFALKKYNGNLEVALEHLLNETDGYVEKEEQEEVSTTEENTTRNTSEKPKVEDEDEKGVSFVVDLTGPIGISFKGPKDSLANNTGGMVSRLHLTPIPYIYQHLNIACITLSI